jgi:hypothetical protein
MMTTLASIPGLSSGPRTTDWTPKKTGLDRRLTAFSHDMRLQAWPKPSSAARYHSKCCINGQASPTNCTVPDWPRQCWHFGCLLRLHSNRPLLIMITKCLSATALRRRAPHHERRSRGLACATNLLPTSHKRLYFGCPSPFAQLRKSHSFDIIQRFIPKVPRFHGSAFHVMGLRCIAS